jgi:hypothetical protein
VLEGMPASSYRSKLALSKNGVINLFIFKVVISDPNFDSELVR